MQGGSRGPYYLNNDDDVTCHEATLLAAICTMIQVWEGRWFRIMGEAGCGLLTHEPDSNFVCGAGDVRWLSGWTDPSGSPPHDYHA